VAEEVGSVVTLSNIVQLYSDSLIFQALPAAEQRQLLASGRKIHFDKDETIFTQGEDGSWMLLIETGIVEVSVIAPDGRKSVLNHLQPGTMLGEVALLDHQGRSAHAVAITSVTGIRLNREAVIQFLKQNNNACLAIIDTLCDRVRNASAMFETRALTSAGARLARCLLRFADKWGVERSKGAIFINQPISQTLLGEFAGVARENVNRYLQTWTQEGILIYRKTGITLLNIGKLQQLAA
jgi:CRP/FNR family cyclic AMP-dependent transcriptional regulator